MAGILAWMVEGCLKWQRLGLKPPKAVTAATAAYWEAEDGLSAWMDEACHREPSGREQSTDLFTS
jgi:putative DNA primase/helicase